MKRHPAVHPYPPALRRGNPLGKLIYCVHCYLTLGPAETEYERQSLLSRHKCPEALLARLPASPPPFN